MLKKKIVKVAPSGAYSLIQEYKPGKDGEFCEELQFKEKTKSAIRLKSYPWPGIYEISPNEEWIIRIQKVGSGTSIAILYHIKKTVKLRKSKGLMIYCGQRPINIPPSKVNISIISTSPKFNTPKTIQRSRLPSAAPMTTQLIKTSTIPFVTI